MAQRHRCIHNNSDRLTDLVGACHCSRLQPNHGVEWYLYVRALAAVQPRVEGQDNSEDSLVRYEQQRLPGGDRGGE